MRKNIITKSWFIGAASLACLFGTNALATPYLGANCKKTLKGPTNGSGVFFSEDCDTAYVLPPTTGKAEMRAIAQNTNLNFCPATLLAGKSAEITAQSGLQIAEMIAKMIKDFDPLKESLEKLRIQDTEKRIEMNSQEEILNQAKQTEEALLSEVETTTATLKQCRALAVVPETECAEQTKEYTDAKGEYKKFLLESLNPAQDKYNKVSAESRKLTALIVSENKKYVEAIKPVLELQDQLTKLDESMFNMYKNYTPLEGIVGQIVYSIDWQKLIDDYQVVNPDSGLTWMRMPVKHASINVVKRAAGGNGLTSGLLWATIPGVSGKQGPAGDFTHANEAIKIAERVPGSDIGSVSVGFDNSVSGQMALNLAGSCAYFPTGLDTSRTAISFNDLTAHLVANADFTYELKARRGYTASYHMSNFVSRVESQSKRGGFFSSKTVHSIVEDTQSSDWFSIKFDADAGEFQYTPEEQATLTKDVKADLIDRALKRIASVNTLNSTPPNLPQLQATGAGAAASTLRSCWWYSWCRVGSYTLGALDSIFGRKEAVSEFKKSNNTWVHESVKGVHMVERNVAVTFGKE